MELNLTGPVLGVASLFIMGVYYPVVIWGEYWFSERIWPLFLLAGTALIGASLFLSGTACYLTAFTGAVNLWAIAEIKEQTRRVRDGKYPRNPRRRYDRY
ncbi:MAG: DUF4491 family protein [Pyramidobacter sp.]|nr:DUF4491 family protein [Pyramidobacter sp.]